MNHFYFSVINTRNIASKTKSFVAMTAACMEEKGLLNLDAPISSFYPGWDFERPLDADSIDLIKVLSHNHQIRNGGLQFRLAFYTPLFLHCIILKPGNFA